MPQFSDTYIFISYSRKDSAIVEQYSEYLNAADLSVWIDKEGIETGDEFKRNIVRAIKNSNVFLFFSSANSNASPWTVKEVNVAVNCKKRIIPVKLDSTPYEESIMFDLAGLDFFDHANNGFEIGIEKLLSVFGKDYSLVVEHIKKEAERKQIEEDKKQQEELFRQQAAIEAQKRIEEEKLARIREEEYKKALADAQRKAVEDERIRKENKGKTRKEIEEKACTDVPEETQKQDNPEGSTQQMNQKKKKLPNKITQERKAIDLGLPSGIKWANMNVGANDASEPGFFYAWGEIEKKERYNSNTYKWGKVLFSGEYTHYRGSLLWGLIPGDNKMFLESSDDVASVDWGDKWRIPTHGEFYELRNNCFWVWTKNYNHSFKQGFIVYKVKSKIDKGKIVFDENTPNVGYSLADTHIFFPAAGLWCYDRVQCDIWEGHYWSSAINFPNLCSLAISLNFKNMKEEKKVDITVCSRFWGLCVRPVYS